MDIKIYKVVIDVVFVLFDFQDVVLFVVFNYYILFEKVNLVYQMIGVEFKEWMIDFVI